MGWCSTRTKHNSIVAHTAELKIDTLLQKGACA